MNEYPTQGWLPVNIQFDAQPSLIPEAPVRWMEFGAMPLADPFFDHTVARLREATPPAREIETSIGSMLRLSSRLPSVTPAGFIFHISRCGSTLIANGLKTAEGAVVVSESQPVTHILLPQSPTIGPSLTARWDRTRHAILDSLFTLFAHYRTGEAGKLIIKFTSINILCLPVVRAYWPNVPCLVVIRDPAEVMVASIPGGGWMSLKSSPQAAARMFGWADSPEAIASMTDEEYSARVMQRFFYAALTALDRHCMVVDYEDLSPKRVRELASFFGLEIPPSGDDLQQTFSVYAKDPTRRTQFKDDRELKRRLANSQVRSAARQWAMAPYNELRGRD
jgi:hypothetical protein